jgi:hypothetical protein
MQSKWLALSLCACFTACATAGIPRDVQAFIDRRDGCDHIRGKAGDYNGDEEREREVNESVAKLCTGTDKELARLRGRFFGNQPVLEKLSKYETRIEARRS